MDNLPGKENNCLILKKKKQFVLKLLRLSVYMVMKSWSSEFTLIDMSEVVINSPSTLNEFALSSLRSYACGTHQDGPISVLALSTRREWRPRLELPRRCSGQGSWWSTQSCNAWDTFSAKTTSTWLCGRRRQLKEQDKDIAKHSPRSGRGSFRLNGLKVPDVFGTLRMGLKLFEENRSGPGNRLKQETRCEVISSKSHYIQHIRPTVCPQATLKGTLTGVYTDVFVDPSGMMYETS